MGSEKLTPECYSRGLISRNHKLVNKPSFGDTIPLKKLVIVEGQDEVHFLNALLEKMKVEGVEVRETGGVDNLRNIIPALKNMPGFSDVEVFGIIRDADENAESAFQSVKNILVRENLLNSDELLSMTSRFSDGRPKLGIFIMPNNSSKGMLESLCLESVKDNPLMKCVDSFIKCSSEVLDKSGMPRNLAKSRAQAFLSVMPKNICSTGLAAEKGYWNFSSDKFNKLKSFLNNLR